MAWYHEVKSGDLLEPDPLWNQSERPQNHLPNPVRVEDVIPAVSQSRVLFAVSTKNGTLRHLDAGWFLRQHLTQENDDGNTNHVLP